MRRLILAAALAAVAGSTAAFHVKSDEHPKAEAAPRAGELVVEQAWARQPLGKTGAAYVTVRNEGAAPDRLLGAATDVAERAELHASTMEDGVMRMRPLDAVEIHPGEPAVMRPGGTHIMLVGVTRPLEEGDRFPLTLRFERAGSVEVMVRVLGPGASGPDDGSHDHGGEGDGPSH